jgi:hypothetical protein
MNGEELPFGIYTYVLRVVDYDGTESSNTGNITLIR